MAPEIWTVGYETLLPEALVAELEATGIERLIDVRYRPQSRRAGMSKTKLGLLLGEHRIAYEHRRELGTPPDIRVDYKQGHVAAGRERMERWVEEEAGPSAALDVLAEEVASPDALRTVLMCLEADPAVCHRRVLVERLADRVPGLVVHDL
ncbi:DUF488 family protein [Patulibacter minatonensis]|uniref:DUF488 domain-containing protein n=1 Tax=Patulibacter minatonensis TaxID=298163 RepID=UPI00047BCB88|nr:DUF488 domain-containing protein [Patulibacter minatonensis]